MRKCKYRNVKKMKDKSEENLLRYINVIEEEKSIVEKEKSLIEKEKSLIENEKSIIEKEKEKLKKRVEELLVQVSSNCVINNAEKITNYTQNISQTIVINNYGNENLKYITGGYLDKLLKIPYKGIQTLIKDIHFNPNHPENHNIKIPNRKEKFAVVYKDGNWELRNKHNVIENIVDNGYNMLDCHYDAGKLILEDVKRNRFIHFQEDFEENDKCRKKIQEETELIMLNKTKLKS